MKPCALSLARLWAECFEDLSLCIPLLTARRSTTAEAVATLGFVPVSRKPGGKHGRQEPF